MSGFQNTRVAARALGVARSDLLKELVGCRTLLDVTARETARVQRAGPRLRDQPLDERPEFLGLRLRGLDRALFDQGRGEVPQKCQSLFAGPTKLSSSMTMPCHAYSSMSSGAAAAA